MARKASFKLGYHKHQHRHYKVIGGKMKYFGPTGARADTEQAAYSEYTAYLNDPVKEVERLPNGSAVAVTPKNADDLSRFAADPVHFFSALIHRIRTDDGITPETRCERLFDAADWMLSALRTQIDQQTARKPKKEKPQGVTLSEVLDFWTAKAVVTAGHRDKTKTHFNDFITTIGDIHLSELSEDHIRDYIDHLEQDGFSPNNQKKYLAGIRLVLNFLTRPKARQAKGYEAFVPHIPPNLLSVTSLCNVDPALISDPKPQEKKPIPVKEFRAILKAVDKTDHATRSILLLALGAGLNATDFGRLTWGESLILDDETPHISLPRIKKGAGERYTPLLPEAVTALIAYRKSLPESKTETGKPVYFGEIYHNRPIHEDRIKDAFTTHRDKAKVKGWTYKHLRNVGANVCSDEGLGIESEWAFLGHTHKLGEARKYEFGNPKRLLPLVNAIRKRYLGNAKTKKGGKK